MSRGTTFSWSRRGWRPWVIRSRCWRIIMGRQQWSFWARAALAPIRSTWAAMSRELRMFSASLPTWPVRVRRIRSTSACSSSRYFLMSLFRFTTAMGSTNRVAPLALWSWTTPGKFSRYSCLMGITYRSSRMVTRASWKYFWLLGSWSRLFSLSFTRFLAARIPVRRPWSFTEALSLMLPFSSRALDSCLLSREKSPSWGP